MGKIYNILGFVEADASQMLVFEINIVQSQLLPDDYQLLC